MVKQKQIFVLITIICVLFLTVATVSANSNNMTENINNEENIEIIDIELDELYEKHDEYGINSTEIQIANDNEKMEDKIIDTNDLVMSDDDFSCGAASFATVLNKLGINITLNEAKLAVNTTSEGTLMSGIISGASKYNLTAYGISTEFDNLKTNYIVHMSFNSSDHWAVIKEIRENHIIISDPNMGNVHYTKEDFCKFYTNNSIIISKSNMDTNLVELKHVKILNEYETKKISGKATKKIRKKAYKQFRVIKYKHKNRLQWRWVYPTEVYSSYNYHKPYKYYYRTTLYSYSSWYFASK